MVETFDPNTVWSFTNVKTRLRSIESQPEKVGLVVLDVVVVVVVFSVPPIPVSVSVW